MVFRFGRFVLDERARELRLEERAVSLQPRVLDLLIHLVRHRDRVVSKDELLETLWPDATVTDASLQRAVSLLRTTLREGGEDGAIRTFARRGYRFCVEGAEPEETAAPSAGAGANEIVASALAATEAGAWDRALELFASLGDGAALDGRALEAWAEAAQCSGTPRDAVDPLERAVAAYAAENDRRGAARAAASLANLSLEGREMAVAKGWHRRAVTLLGDDATCRERGLCDWIAARIALFEGQLDEARARADAVRGLAAALGDADLEAMGLLYGGLVLLATGEVKAGLAMQDEAGAAALAGTTSPWVSGLVFCGVIWAYLNRGDLHRAGQWTDQFTRWCERKEAFGFPGLCRLHRGEVLAAKGELEAAEKEVTEACGALAANARYAEGDAHRVLGEIRLGRGELDAAEEAFRRAHELGWNPVPGLAELHAARGKSDAAIKSLERTLEAPGWVEGQRRGAVLAALVRIAARGGRLEVARDALAELAARPELRAPAAVEAAHLAARGELALAEGRAGDAVVELRRAVRAWLEIDAAVHAAHARLRLAAALVADGDPVAAELELGAAEAAFVAAAAEPMLERCRLLRAELLGEADRG